MFDPVGSGGGQSYLSQPYTITTGKDDSNNFHMNSFLMYSLTTAVLESLEFAGSENCGFQESIDWQVKRESEARNLVTLTEILDIVIYRHTIAPQSAACSGRIANSACRTSKSQPQQCVTSITRKPQCHFHGLSQLESRLLSCSVAHETVDRNRN